MIYETNRYIVHIEQHYMQAKHIKYGKKQNLYICLLEVIHFSIYFYNRHFDPNRGFSRNNLSFTLSI